MLPNRIKSSQAEGCAAVLESLSVLLRLISF